MALSPTAFSGERRYGEHGRKDGNTSDESLLLLTDDNQDRMPLLIGDDHALYTAEDPTSDRSRTASSHCHVPDEKFDYTARNRLILTLIICIIFMIIEIIGTIFMSKLVLNFVFLSRS